MKKLVLGLGLLLTSSFAFANGSCSDSISRISSLTKEQKQAMIVQCEQEKLAVTKKGQDVVATVTDIKTEDLNKISEIAKVAGDTVREVAKELNLAVNEFVKTPVGLFVAGVAVWYVAGEDLSGLVGEIWSVIAAIVGMLILRAIMSNWRKRIEVESYNQVTVKSWFGFSEKVVQVPVLKDVSGSEYYTTLKVIELIGHGILFLFILF